MVGQKVTYNNETYIVIYEYKNGQLEIRKENSKYTVELVKESEVCELVAN